MALILPATKKQTTYRWLLTLALSALLIALPGAGVSHAQVPTESDPTELAFRVLDLVNGERARVGAPPLVLNAQLNAAAQTYADVLATSGCFAHSCGPVPGMSNRLEQAGYVNWAAIAENIAAGQATPEAVVSAWMSSEGHQRNLLNPTYLEMGLGVAWGGQYGIYWSQSFGAQQGGVTNPFGPPAAAGQLEPAFLPLPLNPSPAPVEPAPADPPAEPIAPAQPEPEPAPEPIDYWWPDASWAPDPAASHLWYWDPTVSAWTYFEAPLNNWIYYDPVTRLWMIWNDGAAMWVPIES